MNVLNGLPLIFGRDKGGRGEGVRRLARLDVREEKGGLSGAGTLCQSTLQCRRKGETNIMLLNGESYKDGVGEEL